MRVDDRWYCVFSAVVKSRVRHGVRRRRWCGVPSLCSSHTDNSSASHRRAYHTPRMLRATYAHSFTPTLKKQCIIKKYNIPTRLIFVEPSRVELLSHIFPIVTQLSGAIERASVRSHLVEHSKGSARQHRYRSERFVWPLVHNALSGYSPSGRRRRRPCCTVYALYIYRLRSRDHVRLS